MPLVIVLFAQVAAGAVSAPCTEQERRALVVAETLIERGDGGALEEAASSRVAPLDGDCARAHLSRTALLGWAAARRLAPKGGAPALLAPVQQQLDALDRLRDQAPGSSNQGPVRGADAEALDLQIEYAQSAIRAAVAAAQDERPEMELWLTHARDLTERLSQRGRRAVWPRSFNLLAGELWFEVDRFEDARAAFARAVSADPTPLALVGLARAEARLDSWDQACATYARVRGAAPPLRRLAASELTRCR